MLCRFTGRPNFASSFSQAAWEIFHAQACRADWPRCLWVFWGTPGPSDHRPPHCLVLTLRVQSLCGPVPFDNLQHSGLATSKAELSSCHANRLGMGIGNGGLAVPIGDLICWEA